MRRRRLLILLCAALALSACARQVPRYAAAPEGAVSELDVRMYGAPQPASYPVRRVAQVVPVAARFEDGPYTLDSGDKLRIVVFGQDALSNNYAVDAQGAVSLPLVGAIEARGLTTAQLGSAIAGRLKSGYVRDPSVAVEVETYRPFFVLGEVTYPGQYPYVPNMTAENAIAIAGGFTPRAEKDNVTITRKVQGVPARSALPLRYRSAPATPSKSPNAGSDHGRPQRSRSCTSRALRSAACFATSSMSRAARPRAATGSASSATAERRRPRRGRARGDRAADEARRRAGCHAARARPERRSWASCRSRAIARRSTRCGARPRRQGRRLRAARVGAARDPRLHPARRLAALRPPHACAAWSMARSSAF